MKKLCIVCCLMLVCTLTIRAQYGVTWSAKSVKPELASMRAIDMRTTEIGIAVGEAGMVWCYYGNNDVQPYPVLAFATTSVDGMLDMYGVAYNSVGTAVAVGDSGQVWRSTDDGRSWTLQTRIATSRLTAIAGDDTTFVAVGNGCICVSTNDGVTWTTSEYDSDIRDVAGSVEDGWMIVGEGVSFSSNLASWADVTPNPDIVYKKVDMVKAAEAHTGVRFGIAGDPYFMASTDNNGTTWTNATIPEGIAQLYPRAETKCFEWKDNAGPAIWMLEDRYAPEEITFLSNNTQLNYVRQPVGDQLVSFVYDAIAFVSMDRIVGVGPGGQSHTVLYDNSIPRLWFSSNIDVSLFLKSASISGDNHLIVGNQSNVMVAASTNGGLSYKTVFESPQGNTGVNGCIARSGAYIVMYDSMFVDNSEFPPATKRMACIIRSTNGGASWNRVFASPNRLPAQGVSITPDGTIVARTYGNTWFVSSDEGITWDSLHLGGTGLYFLPPSSIDNDSVWTTTAYNAATQSYTLYRSTDRITWEQKAMVSNATDYEFTSATTGYAVCNVVHQQSPADDEIYKTTDGGDSWNLIYRRAGALGLNCITIDTAANVLVAMGTNAHAVVMSLSDPNEVFVDSSLRSKALYGSTSQVLTIGRGTYLAVGPLHNLYLGTLLWPTTVRQYSGRDYGLPFPNPVSSKVTIPCNAMVIRAHLVDATGSEAALPFEQFSDHVTVDLSATSPGSYYVALRTLTGVCKIMRLVKQ